MTHHVVCHDCTFEKLTKGALAAEEALEDHEEATGHNVKQQFVGFERASRFVTDGGRDVDDGEYAREQSMWFCPKCETWVGWKRDYCGESHGRPRRPLHASDVDKKPAWEVTLWDRLKAKVGWFR